MDVVAHEIRTPLSLIKGAAELLESAGPLTDEQKQFTKTIQTNAEHAIAVAEDFLALAKLDASETTCPQRPLTCANSPARRPGTFAQYMTSQF